MSLEVTVVSRAEQLYEGTASYVSAPAADGQVGILPGRQPFLGALKSGKVLIHPEDKTAEPIELQVEPGFISVDSDQVMIVVD